MSRVAHLVLHRHILSTHELLPVDPAVVVKIHARNEAAHSDVQTREARSTRGERVDGDARDLLGSMHRPDMSAFIAIPNPYLKDKSIDARLLL